MVFSSLTFVFFFLPLVLCSYFVIKSRKHRNAILILFSLVFYSWGEPKLVALMMTSVLAAYFGGMLIERYQQKNENKKKKVVYVITNAVLLSALFVFKYLGFAETTIFKLFKINKAITNIVLPIGISFYTFQILSYIIDLYRGDVEVQKNPLKLLLYVSLFPQLIAGPIVRYKTIADEISNRNETLDEAEYGARRFILGLAKKVILANNLALITESIYKMDVSAVGTLALWVAAIAYTLQIYFDFSGYSDMAIGLGRIFGFHFLENFDYPYRATSVTEFWRRWHISLSSWFRDYIYIPLGGNRVAKSRWILNILIVWSLTGLWHGAEWNFVIWGLYYGIILLLEKLVFAKVIENTPKIIRWILTFIVVIVGWTIFNITDFEKLGCVLMNMFSYSKTCWSDVLSLDISLVKTLIWLPIGMLFMFPLVKNVLNKLLGEKLKNVILIGLFAITIMFMLSNTYNPFIYFRF